MTAFDRTQWELTILNARLAPGPTATALALAVCAGGDGRAWPGERRLAAISAQSRSAVYYHLRGLADAGLIEREHDAACGMAATYRLVMPEPAP